MPVGDLEPGAATRERGSVREVALLATRLGATAFGGPAAHIALLHREIVVERQWIGPHEFERMLGLTNLLPGPNSTEMVMHAGYVRAGHRGLVAAGICFILPGALMTLGLAVGYGRVGESPTAQAFLLGVQAAVVAVLVQALWRLLRPVSRSWVDWAGIAFVAALALAGLPELWLLFAAGGLIGIGRIALRRRSTASVSHVFVAAMLLGATVESRYSHQEMVLAFLKIGAMLYGSGYVLISLLDDVFVRQLGWLSTSQVVDAVAAGQMTPGPLFSSATFIGYELGGYAGAALATVAIFLPAFLFVAIAAPLLPRLAQNPDLLDLVHGVSIAAIGLLVAVTVTLGQSSFESWMGVAVLVISGVALLRYGVNSALVIAVGGLLAMLMFRSGVGA